MKYGAPDAPFHIWCDTGKLRAVLLHLKKTNFLYKKLYNWSMLIDQGAFPFITVLSTLLLYCSSTGASNKIFMPHVKIADSRIIMPH